MVHRTAPLTGSPGSMDYLETVAVWILEKHRVIIVAVLGHNRRALDILSSNPANYFPNSINLFT